MNQNNMILSHLQKGGSITPQDALELFGCFRLGARIYDLRQAGFDIRCEMEQGVNRLGYPVRYARYYMEGGNKNA